MLQRRNSQLARWSPENPKRDDGNERLEEGWEGTAEEASQEVDPVMTQQQIKKIKEVGNQYKKSASLVAQKESACHVGDPGSIPGLEVLREKGLATQSSILAWRILLTEEPSGLQSMESQSRTQLNN